MCVRMGASARLFACGFIFSRSLWTPGAEQGDGDGDVDGGEHDCDNADEDANGICNNTRK